MYIFVNKFFKLKNLQITSDSKGYLEGTIHLGNLESATTMITSNQNSKIGIHFHLQRKLDRKTQNMLYLIMKANLRYQQIYSKKQQNL